MANLMKTVQAKAASARRLPPRWGGWLLALPPMLFTLLFFLAPLVLLIIYSFGKINILNFEIQFGWNLDNWTTLGNGVYLSGLIRSLVLTVVSTVLCAVIGFPAALAISRASGRIQTVLLLAIIVPYWISFVVRNYAWLTLLGPHGLVTRLLTALHLTGPGQDLRYTTGAILVGMVSSYLPLMILPIFVAMERIDPAVLDAAADLGLSGLATLRRVILPLSMPGFIAGILLVGIPATGEYTIPAILGGGKTLMVGNLIHDQFLGVGNIPVGSAIATALMGLMLVLLLATRRRVRQLEDVL
jgi:spermidine/putrescine transport system permease protein